jgi:hypothetical protein
LLVAFADPADKTAGFSNKKKERRPPIMSGRGPFVCASRSQHGFAVRVERTGF